MDHGNCKETTEIIYVVDHMSQSLKTRKENHFRSLKGHPDISKYSVKFTLSTAGGIIFKRQMLFMEVQRCFFPRIAVFLDWSRGRRSPGRGLGFWINKG